MSTIAERVAAGAAFLDERDPGWVARIDLDELDLNNVCLCVLGQTFAGQVGGDARAPSYYGNGYDWAMAAFDIRHGAEFGFDAEDGEDYDDLAAEWKRFITECRAGDVR